MSTIQNGEELELDTNAVKQRQNTYTSLTDLNGIALFSDEFESNEKIRLEKEQESSIQLQQSVFVKTVVEEDTNQITEKMFQTTQESILRDNTEQNAYTKYNSLFLTGLIILCIISICLLMKVKPKKRRQRVC